MDDTQKMYVVMPIYNLLHEPALNSNGEIIDVLANNNNSSLFKF